MSDILKENYQKALNKLTLLFFFSNPVDKVIKNNGLSYQIQKEPGTSDQSLFRLGQS